MKTAVIIAVAGLALSAVSPIRSAEMKGMDMDHKGMEGMPQKKGDSQVHKATGKVTKVDPAAGAVTIAHEPVPSLKWPAMTMAFKIRDKSMLEKTRRGAKVDFSFTQSGKDYVITEIK